MPKTLQTLSLLFFPTLLFVDTSAAISADAQKPVAASKPTVVVPYRELVLQNNPAAYWSFDKVFSASGNATASSPTFPGRVVGRVQIGATGPVSDPLLIFGSQNLAVEFFGSGGSLRIKDPSKSSPLDFDKGDSLTITAWVNPVKLKSGQYSYIIGKGRTNNKGVSANNQNYAIRIMGSGNSAKLNFLFRSAGPKPDWHRWTSKQSFPTNTGWHHVALCFTFGDGNSLTGYIDGKKIDGVWDYGGKTDKAPVVDNDEVWIGTSLGGQVASSFHGSIDEIAIFRSVLSAEVIRKLAPKVLPPPPIAPPPPLAESAAPADSVLVEVVEGIPDARSWDFVPAQPTESYNQNRFAFIDFPVKYSSKGIRLDRSSPFLVRSKSLIHIPKGKHRLLIRCRNASRLFFDGVIVSETPFHNIVGTAHGTVHKIDKSAGENIRPVQRGDNQKIVEITGDGKLHELQFEMIIGGKRLRPEPGDAVVCVASSENGFQVVSPFSEFAFPLTNTAWSQFVSNETNRFIKLNSLRRQIAGAEETRYWNFRHDLARQKVKNTPSPKLPEVASSDPVLNNIDRFIVAQLNKQNLKPTVLINDWAFLRRVTLDIIGTIPTEELIAEFFAEPAANRRSRYIDKLLQHPGWADHWVGYWQDVLAENPNIVNPTLNNTGPFRWWIHSSFLDNKPFDRFAAELVMMEGSTHFGGPGGFSMASQNDVPMAAKAHIVGQAFLGLEMKCARCHDAPFHDLTQTDLFSLAAMLKRTSQTIPKTSSIPLSQAAIDDLIVNVSVKPGSSISPAWNFTELNSVKIPAGVLRNTKDQREEVAALITLPENKRFSQVIVNRLWKRYLGIGIVEPVDDWEDADPSHPELLDYLSREFLQNNYDLKHIARLILNSHTYQRTARNAEEVVQASNPYYFQSPVLRRLSAEQLVDSLFLAAGKDFDAGLISIDSDGSRIYTSSLTLGIATKAWHFTSLSNERDRPSLALPYAQPFVTTLETFGWRTSRQSPLTVRNEDPTVLQPALLANGVLSRRVTVLSDQNAFTDLAFADVPLGRLIEQVYLRILSRQPSAAERKSFAQLLGPGYDNRRDLKASKTPKQEHPLRYAVSWSNHLNPRANEIKVELEQFVKQGETPTKRLKPGWRERMEDAIWVLINSPEFVYLP